MKQAEPISMRVLVWMIVLLKQTRFVMENTFERARVFQYAENAKETISLNLP